MLIALVVQEQKTGVSTHFELADNLYAKATITEGNTVLLWLGVRLCACVLAVALRPDDVLRSQANVMVEYEYKEALALLTKNLEVRVIVDRALLCLDRVLLAECGEGIGVAGAGHCVPEGPDHHL